MMETLLPFLPAFAVAYGILFVAASSPGPAVAMLMGLSVGKGRTAQAGVKAVVLFAAPYVAGSG